MVRFLLPAEGVTENLREKVNTSRVKRDEVGTDPDAITALWHLCTF